MDLYVDGNIVCDMKFRCYFQPSDSEGGLCADLNPPYYVNNCQYNGAQRVLEQVDYSLCPVS